MKIKLTLLPVTFDADKNIIGSYFEEEFEESLVPEGCTYEIKYYEGCPAHSS